MRIALCTDTFFPQVNGIATSVEAFARELGRKGHDVMVVCPDVPGTDSPASKNGFRILSMRSTTALLYPQFRFVWSGFSAAARALDDFRSDVVHFHTPFTIGRFAVRYAKRRGIPLVGTNHIFLSKDNTDFVRCVTDIPVLKDIIGGFVRQSMRRLYRRCNVRAAVTHLQISSLLDDGWEPPIEYLPNGIDASAFHILHGDERVRVKNHWKLKSRVIGHLGRLSDEKNVHAVLRAFIEVRKEISDVSLLLIGDGPSRKKLERMAAEAGVGDDVVFTGMVPRSELFADGLLSVADVFVTASMTESQGIVLLEAMALGLPALCMEGGAASEVVRDVGVVVARNDVRGLTEALNRVLQEENYVKELSKKSLAQSAKFSIHVVIETLLALYAKAQSSK